MPLVSGDALVLQTFSYSETSKILRLLMPEHGLRSVVAKGALRPKSRFGGLLEPFTEGIASFYLRDTRDLHTLSGFDLTRSRQSLGRDLVGFAGASLLAEIAIRVATEEPHATLYTAIRDGWDRIVASPQGSEREAAVFDAAWQVIALAGFAPEMRVCVGCSVAFGGVEASRFDAEAGGAACQRCRPVGRLVDAATRAEIAAMTRGIPATLTHRALHHALLHTFLDQQIAHGRPLRSLELFRESAMSGV